VSEVCGRSWSWTVTFRAEEFEEQISDTRGGAVNYHGPLGGSSGTTKSDLCDPTSSSIDDSWQERHRRESTTSQFTAERWLDATPPAKPLRKERRHKKSELMLMRRATAQFNFIRRLSWSISSNFCKNSLFKCALHRLSNYQSWRYGHCWLVSVVCVCMQSLPTTTYHDHTEQWKLKYYYTEQPYRLPLVGDRTYFSSKLDRCVTVDTRSDSGPTGGLNPSLWANTKY